MTTKYFRPLLITLKTIGLACALSWTVSAQTSVDQTENWQQGCDNQVADDCLELGKYNLSLRNADYNEALGWELLERGCELGSGAACTLMGRHQNQGRGDEQDFINSAPYFKRACQLLDGEGCFAFARINAIGKGVERNLVVAVEYLKKGCAKSYGEACYQAAALHLEGEHVKKNVVAAAGFLEAGCGFNDARSCNLWGELLVKGDEVLPNYEKAATAFEKVCKREAKAAFKFEYGKGCGNLASLLDSSDSLVQDEAQILGLFKIGCENSHGKSCFKIGSYLVEGKIVPKNIATAFVYSLRACALAYVEGCERAVHMYNDGAGVQPSGDDAFTYFNKKCKTMPTSPSNTLAFRNEVLSQTFHCSVSRYLDKN